MALFVTSISFDDPALADEAKIGILFGSTIAGIIGYAMLRFSAPTATAEAVEPQPEAEGAGTGAEAVPQPV